MCSPAPIPINNYSESAIKSNDFSPLSISINLIDDNSNKFINAIQFSLNIQIYYLFSSNNIFKVTSGN